MKIRPTPQTIWKRPAYLPYVQSDLTEEALAAAENRLGYKLPQTLVEILKVQNGGPVRFRLPESVGDTIAGIGDKYPSLLSQDLAEAQEYVDFSLDGLVPFDGDGHWYHCLDYRDDEKNPGVSYIDIECNSQDSIADSFAAFLGMMELSLERELVLRDVENAQAAKHKLQNLFGVAPEEKISNIGVPYSKFQIGDDWRNCCWISSNQVASGYSGESPATFEFLGTASLFPELPDDAVIFECPVERLEKFSELLRSNQMELISIELAASAG